MERENVIRVIIGAGTFAAVLASTYFAIPDLIVGTGTLVALAFVGWEVFGEALEELREEHSLSEDALVSIAALGALCLGQFAEAIAVMTLFVVGEAIEDAAEDKSSDNVKAMLAITSDTACVLQEGVLADCSAAEVPVGSIVVVRPGEKVPIDGIVIKGASSLDCSALTGESQPVAVTVGDVVHSGSINAADALQVQTTATFDDSTAAKLVRLARDAAQKKAASEVFITRFARIYTPAVCALAAVVGLGVPLVAALLGQASELGTWMYRALSLLVVSCPCALVISVPLAYVATIGAASKNGLLIKGACFVDTIARAKTFASDKTGTLTTASGGVVVQVESDRPGLALRLAAYAESQSTHPIALAIQRAFAEPINPLLVCGVREVPGCGVQAMVEGACVVVGSRAYLESLGIEASASDRCDECVFVACDGVQVGALRLSEDVKPNALRFLKDLASLGISKFVLLSGDSERAVGRVAQQLGIIDYRANLLPEQKIEAVEALIAASENRAPVAFVGDGVNDAPVLARSDVGIAMGALGSDAAIEAADLVVLDDDLAKIPFAIRLSRACLRIVHANIAFALAIKLACLILVACGVAGMWVAICADMGVMILCVLNSFRLLYDKRG